MRTSLAGAAHLLNNNAGVQNHCARITGDIYLLGNVEVGPWERCLFFSNIYITLETDHVEKMLCTVMNTSVIEVSGALTTTIEKSSDNYLACWIRYPRKGSVPITASGLQGE